MPHCADSTGGLGLHLGLRDEVIDRDHPDFDYWAEAHAIEEWAADDASPEPRAAAESARSPEPKLALSLAAAAHALDVSDDFFREHVKPELRIVRRGRRQFIARAELERWLAASGET